MQKTILQVAHTHCFATMTLFHNSVNNTSLKVLEKTRSSNCLTIKTRIMLNCVFHECNRQGNTILEQLYLYVAYKEQLAYHRIIVRRKKLIPVHV